jgi:hypothetical protein
MVAKDKVVVCCLLFASHIGHNISCDVHLLNELLETDVP